jgi:hypothetical protein
MLDSDSVDSWDLVLLHLLSSSKFVFSLDFPGKLIFTFFSVKISSPLALLFFAIVTGQSETKLSGRRQFNPSCHEFLISNSLNTQRQHDSVLEDSAETRIHRIGQPGQDHSRNVPRNSHICLACG